MIFIDFSRNYDPKLPFATRKFYLCLLHRITIALILTGILFIRYWWLKRKTMLN